MCLCSFENALATSSATADFYTQRKPMSATINTLANALYKVFCYTGKWGSSIQAASDRLLRSTFIVHSVWQEPATRPTLI